MLAQPADRTSSRIPASRIPASARRLAKGAFGLLRKPGDLEYLLDEIQRGEPLNTRHLRRTVGSIEAGLRDPASDPLSTHVAISMALFARSPDLYRGVGLPEFLRRYTYPPYLALHLNTHCNAACFFCREADYKGTLVDHADLAKLDNAVRHARTIDFTGWGEPFTYPRLADFIDRCVEINPALEFSCATNGSVLSKRWGERLSGRLKYMTVSVNAATEATYAAQMRYKSSQFTLRLIIENLTTFMAALTARDRSRIGLHMVTNSGNFHEIPDLVQLASDGGVGIVTIGHFICAKPQHLDKTLWHVKEAYNDALTRGIELGAKLNVSVSGRRFFVNEASVSGREGCRAPFESFFIETPGSATPCCFLGETRMGSVYEDGFEAVWFGDHMQKLRHSRHLPACQRCTIFSPFDDVDTHVSSFLALSDTDSDMPTHGSISAARKAKRSGAARHI